MDWSVVEQREVEKKKAAIRHREALEFQKEELKKKRILEKQNDLIESQKVLFGQSRLAMNPTYDSSSLLDTETTQPTATQPPNSNDTMTVQRGGLVAALSPLLSYQPLPISSQPPVPLALELKQPERVMSPVLLAPAAPAVTYSNLSLGQPDTETTTTTSDIQVRLQITQEQLQNERMYRTAIERELHAQKTAMFSLFAKIEQLQQTTASDSSSLRSVMKTLDEHRRSFETENQELRNKVIGQDHLIRQLTTQVSLRTKQLEETRTAEEETRSMVMEELSALKYKIEHMNLETVQADKELFKRTRDLENDTKLASDLKNSLQEHEHMIVSMKKEYRDKLDTTTASLQSHINGLKAKLDQEAHARMLSEKHAERLLSDLKHLISGQDSETNNRLQMLRNTLLSVTGREMETLDSRIESITKEMHEFDKRTSQREMTILASVDEKLELVKAMVREEVSKRVENEQRIGQDMEKMTRMMNDAAMRHNEALEKALGEVKMDTNKIFKKFQESLMLVEKEALMKLSALEEILRVEIKTRLENETKNRQLIDESSTRLLHSIESEITDKMKTITIANEALIEKSSLDLCAKIDASVKSLRGKELNDIETQISTLRKRVKESEVTFRTKLKALAAETDVIKSANAETIEQIKSNAFVSLNNFDAVTFDLESKLGQMQISLDELKLSFTEQWSNLTQKMDQKIHDLRDNFKSKLSSLSSEKSEKDAMVDAAVGVNTRQFQERVDQVDASLKLLTQQLKSVTDMSKEQGGSIQGIRTELLELVSARKTMQEKFNVQIEELGDANEKLSTSLKQVDTNVSSLSKKIQTISPVFDQLKKDVDILSRSVDMKADIGVVEARAQRVDDLIHKLNRELQDTQETIDIIQVRLRKKDTSLPVPTESREKRSRTQDDLSWKQYIQERVDQVESMLNQRLTSQQQFAQDSATNFSSRENENTSRSNELYSSQQLDAAMDESTPTVHAPLSSNSYPVAFPSSFGSQMSGLSEDLIRNETTGDSPLYSGLTSYNSISKPKSETIFNSGMQTSTESLHMEKERNTTAETINKAVSVPLPESTLSTASQHQQSGGRTSSRAKLRHSQADLQEVQSVTNKPSTEEKSNSPILF